MSEKPEFPVDCECYPVVDESNSLISKTHRLTTSNCKCIINGESHENLKLFIDESYAANGMHISIRKER